MSKFQQIRMTNGRDIRKTEEKKNKNMKLKGSYHKTKHNEVRNNQDYKLILTTGHKKKN